MMRVQPKSLSKRVRAARLLNLNIAAAIVERRLRNQTKPRPMTRREFRERFLRDHRATRAAQG